MEKMRLTGLEPATQGLGIPCSIHTELQAQKDDIRMQGPLKAQRARHLFWHLPLSLSNHRKVFQ